MAERKLTKSELKMKQRDPKKFAELQKIRARRAKGYKRTLRDLSISPKLSMRSGPKVVKPTKKKKVTRNQRIGGGTMKPGLNAAVKSAEEKEDKRTIAKPIIKKKPLVLKNVIRRGTLKPGLNAAVKSANKREDKIRPFGKKKPTVVKPTSRKTTPLDLTYRDDEGSPIGTVDRKSKPKKLRTLTEAMFGSDQTPENEMVRNPFTGKPMSLEYDFPEDPEDMKKGGSIKKKIKV